MVLPQPQPAYIEGPIVPDTMHRRHVAPPDNQRLEKNLDETREEIRRLRERLNQPDH